MESENVLDLLERDSFFRQLSNLPDAPIYTLEEIEVKPWDFSYPTFVKDMPENEYGQVDLFQREWKLRVVSSEEFRKDFFKKYPPLTNIDWTNMFVAGGSVGQFVGGVYPHRRYQNPGDVDIFLYGLSVEQAEAKVQNICSGLEEWRLCQIAALEGAGKHVPPELKRRSKYVRTKNTLTINHTYQIVFRIYENLKEVLYGFDLGSSAIGFDGTSVYLSEMGRFAYTYGCNIVDPSRRSTTYEHRLEKYFKRSFAIIVPKFKVDALSTEAWDDYKKESLCIMPHLVFEYSERVGNAICVTQFFRKKGAYQTSDYDHLERLGEYARYYTNIHFMCIKDYERVIFTDSDAEKIMRNPNGLQYSRVTFFYHTLFQKIPKREFPVGMVSRYIKVKTPEEVFECRDKPEALKEIEVLQLEALRQSIEEMKTLPPHVVWITENAGTQMTSSFNPIIEDPKDWYGKTYYN